MAKYFAGLGQFDFPYTADGKSSVSRVDNVPLPGGRSMNVVVDRSNLSDLNDRRRVHPSNPSANDRAKITSFVSNNETQVLSQESGPAPYETLFNDFDIETFPVYNFWTADELTNDDEDRGNRKLEDVPRYVRVVWNSAPDLPEPSNFLLRSKKKRPIEPVKFSSETKLPVSHTHKGVSFSPQHLDPKHFDLVARSLVNGQLEPGIVNAIVDMPLGNAGLDSVPMSSEVNEIDEDVFLTSNDTKGVSSHELRGNVHNLTNALAGTSRVDGSQLRQRSLHDKSEIFDGKYAVKISPFTGGKVQIGSVGASSSPLSFETKTASVARDVPQDQVIDLVRSVGQPDNVCKQGGDKQIRAKFIYTALGGVIDEKKIGLMSKIEHAETVTALAQVLPNLEMLARSGIHNRHRDVKLVSFLSPSDLKPLEYVGYVLEKYAKNGSGVFELVETILLPSRDYDEYVDTKVVYGGVYRYRIRTIMRWTRSVNVDHEGRDESVIEHYGSQTHGIATYQSSYVAGEWSKQWAYGSLLDMVPPSPPDELTVRPDSFRKLIVVTFKLPDNSQRDISSMRLFRKIQDSFGQDKTEWAMISESRETLNGSELAPSNVIFNDPDVEYFQEHGLRYVYAAQTLSKHGESSVLSEQLAARLNRDYASYGEFGIDFVSSPGVRMEYFGAFATSPIRKSSFEVVAAVPPAANEEAVRKASFVFSGREAVGNAAFDDSDYVLRVESLDTGEVRDVELGMLYKNQKEEVRSDVSDVHVPSQSLTSRNERSSGRNKAGRIKNDSRKNRDKPSHPPGKRSHSVEKR
jgi:hypothetical protein